MCLLQGQVLGVAFVALRTGGRTHTLLRTTRVQVPGFGIARVGRAALARPTPRRRAPRVPGAGHVPRHDVVALLGHTLSSALVSRTTRAEVLGVARVCRAAPAQVLGVALLALLELDTLLRTTPAQVLGDTHVELLVQHLVTRAVLAV